MLLLIPLLSSFLFEIAAGSPCKDVEVSTKSYTTEDATVLSQIAYISEFVVKCNPSSSSPGNLYALFKENIIPVANVAPNKYQLSWTEDLKTAQVGEIVVKVFDEDGYAALKKALRNGDNIQEVMQFTTVAISHPGAYKGPCISCEFLAALFSLSIAYYAVHLRVKFVS
ncbi:translocon-associated protein subunit delta-like [Coccinella septempunctata]|uniref:translocon-associated protein subunit delta-like n=1 Tax=Coccinella septempunctata TaxID=41139 RepID=UPI001D066C96|nr:translocon-associated protein subunit delta-like [Coccinella septempunctata]